MFSRASHVLLFFPHTVGWSEVEELSISPLDLPGSHYVVFERGQPESYSTPEEISSVLCSVAPIFPCAYWKYIICTSIFHTCIALVANTHLLGSWYRSFICNSWWLRPAYGRDLYSYAGDITQLIVFLLFWCETPPFPPVSSVWQYSSVWQCWPVSSLINFP